MRMAYLHFMMICRLITGLCLLALFSCKTTSQVTGIYHADKNTGAQLLLKTDSTFEWVYPGSKTVEIGTDNTTRNLFYYTDGKWKLERGRLLLSSSPSNDPYTNSMANDSISRFTSISSFNFWNRYGEQVNIRSIQLPRAKPKPHFGNTLYFFAQDFQKNDTLVFYLDGYRSFTYPGSIPATIGNNIHKITLYEPYSEPGKTVVKIKGKRLFANGEYYAKKNRPE